MFICQEVEYLGHLITPIELKTNKRLVDSMREFPLSQDVSEKKRFLDLSPYYRRFIHEYATITHPLNALARKMFLLTGMESVRLHLMHLRRG